MKNKIIEIMKEELYRNINDPLPYEVIATRILEQLGECYVEEPKDSAVIHCVDCGYSYDVLLDECPTCALKKPKDLASQSPGPNTVTEEPSYSDIETALHDFASEMQKLPDPKVENYDKILKIYQRKLNKAVLALQKKLHDTALYEVQQRQAEPNTVTEVREIEKIWRTYSDTFSNSDTSGWQDLMDKESFFDAADDLLQQRQAVGVTITEEQVDELFKQFKGGSQVILKRDYFGMFIIKLVELLNQKK